MSELLTYLTSAWDVYEKTSWEDKYVLINQIFSGGLQFVESAFKSDELNPVFRHTKGELREKNLLMNQTKYDFMKIKPEPNTSIPPEELDLLNIIATIIVEITMNIRLNTSDENTKRVQI